LDILNGLGDDKESVHLIVSVPNLGHVVALPCAQASLVVPVAGGCCIRVEDIGEPVESVILVLDHRGTWFMALKQIAHGAKDKTAPVVHRIHLVGHAVHSIICEGAHFAKAVFERCEITIRVKSVALRHAVRLDLGSLAAE